jgi:2-keto-4-pentenoate hydratase/2-oxohepta-3-ene-1,7-dioic acid hydratase in catechol pathway
VQVEARVNGELRQSASTRDLVVSIPRAIEWLSRHLTLRPGDLVLMGTPAGVGPLADGDRVECSVSGIGKLVTHIRRPA